MRCASWVALAASLAACGHRDPDRGAAPKTATVTASPPKSDQEIQVITFDVRGTEDLQRLTSEYMTLAQAGAPRRVEIRVAPGAEIGQTAWSLAPEMGASRLVPLDVVIDGGGGSLPLFRSIVARSLRLENVALTNSAQASIWVSRDFTMKRAMLIDCRRVNGAGDAGSGAGQSLVAIHAIGSEAVDVAIEDSWFVRNFQDRQPERMIRLTSGHENAAVYDTVRIARSAFVGNAFAADVGVEHAKRVEVVDSFFVRTWPGKGSELACSNCGAISVEGSRFALQRLDQVVTLDDTPPLRMSRSELHVQVEGKQLPESVVPGDSKIFDRSQLGSDARIAALIDRLATEPVRVPADAVWTELPALFGNRAP